MNVSVIGGEPLGGFRVAADRADPWAGEAEIAVVGAGPAGCAAAASGPRNSPQTLSRASGVRSSSSTRRPARARTIAAAQPAGPAPTTATSDSSSRERG